MEKRGSYHEILESSFLKSETERHAQRLTTADDNGDARVPTLVGVDTLSTDDPTDEIRYKTLSPVTANVLRSLDTKTSMEHMDRVMHAIVSENDLLMEIINMYTPDPNEDNAAYPTIAVPQGLRERAKSIRSRSGSVFSMSPSLSAASLHQRQSFASDAHLHTTNSTKSMSYDDRSSSMSSSLSDDRDIPYSGTDLNNCTLPGLSGVTGNGSKLVTVGTQTSEGGGGNSPNASGIAFLDEYTLAHNSNADTSKDEGLRDMRVFDPHGRGQVPAYIQPVPRHDTHVKSVYVVDANSEMPPLSHDMRMGGTGETTRTKNRPKTADGKTIAKRRKKREQQQSSDALKAAADVPPPRPHTAPPAMVPLAALKLQIEKLREQQREQEEKLLLLQSHGGASDLTLLGDDEKPPDSPVAAAHISLVKAQNVIVHQHNILKILDSENGQLEHIAQDFDRLLQERRVQNMSAEPIFFVSHKSAGSTLTHFAQSTAAQRQQSAMDDEAPVSAILSRMPYLKREDQAHRFTHPVGVLGKRPHPVTMKRSIPPLRGSLRPFNT